MQLDKINILNRSNDLEEFFWPIFYFVKKQIIENQTLPLWNNLFFSGMPLLPDPQAPLFYPPNVLFLFLPLGFGFLISFFLHSLLGGIGMYLCSRYSFRLSKLASIFAASLYIVAPRFAGYLEAGHFGLVASWAWLPFIILAVVGLTRTPKFAWAALLAISMAGVFYTHLLTFLLAAVASGILFVFLLFQKTSLPKKALKFFAFSGILTFGLISIALLPQLEWKDYTTRSILATNPDVYPKWISLKEFLISIFWPWKNIWELDPEKFVALGLGTVLLAIIGVSRFNRRVKIAVLITAVFVSIVALNNASPFYPLLISQPLYASLRVATRVWFIVVLLVIFLAGCGADFLLRKNRMLALFAMTIVVFEVSALSFIRLAKPVLPETGVAPKEVYDFLKQDKGQFRVFCTTRCLSQKEAAQAGLELIEGYNTLQQLNYYKQMWQLTGSYWDYYTLALPPIGTAIFEENQPDPESLGKFNTKYVISPYKLTDKNFIPKAQFDNYMVYQNKLFQPRAYFWTENQKPGFEAKVITYSPNKIRVDTSLNQTSRLVLSEVWNPGWVAFLNGQEIVPVQEKPDALRLIDIKPDTKFVDFVYEPNSFKTGRAITVTTIIILTIIVLGRYHTLLRRSV